MAWRSRLVLTSLCIGCIGVERACKPAPDGACVLAASFAGSVGGVGAGAGAGARTEEGSRPFARCCRSQTESICQRASAWVSTASNLRARAASSMASSASSLSYGSASPSASVPRQSRAGETRPRPARRTHAPPCRPAVHRRWSCSRRRRCARGWRGTWPAHCVWPRRSFRAQNAAVGPVVKLPALDSRRAAGRQRAPGSG